MSPESIFYSVVVIALAILVPFFIIKDIKRGKKLTDVFIRNIVLVVIFVVAAVEVLKIVLQPETMRYINQFVFLGVILLVVIPLIWMQLLTVKEQVALYKDPTKYKYKWAYKYRFVLLAGGIALFFGAMYRFYIIYTVLF